MADPNSSNGRVTMAVLGSKLDTVIQQQKNMIEKQDLLESVLYEHSVHIETLSGQVNQQCQRLDGRIDTEVAHAQTARATLAGRISEVDGKVKGWQGIQAVITLIGSAIAAWLGVKL